MLESYSPCWPHDLFIMGLFSFFSVNAINIDYVYVYVRLEDMIKDRIGTKLNQLYKIDTIFFLIDKIWRGYSICYLPYEYHLTP